MRAAMSPACSLPKETCAASSGTASVPDGEVDGLGESELLALYRNSSCCGPTTSARSSTTARAASARTRSSGTTRRCRRAPCSRSRTRLDLPELPRVGDRAAARDAAVDDALLVARASGGLVESADYNVASICVPIATHVPHAVGLAWGKRLQGERRVAIAYFGDGATSEGAFHEGANFAGVMRAPADPLLQQQPVGDLDAALGADRRADAGRQGDRLRDAGRPGRRRRRARRVRGDAGGGRAGARRRRADVHRGGDVPRGAARDRRRSVGLHRPRARRGGEAERVRRALRALPPPARRLLRRGRGGGRRRRRSSSCARGIAAAEAEPPADPALVFEHAYADRPRRRRTISPSSGGCWWLSCSSSRR